jgi:hypothetical protein
MNMSWISFTGEYASQPEKPPDNPIPPPRPENEPPRPGKIPEEPIAPKPNPPQPPVPEPPAPPTWDFNTTIVSWPRKNAQAKDGQPVVTFIA